MKVVVVRIINGIQKHDSLNNPNSDLYHGSDGYTYRNIGGEFNRI